jgi:hypothetical protein
MEAKFNPRDIRPTLRLFATLIYAVVVIIASAGVLNYGVENGTWIHIVAGVLNLVFGLWTVGKEIENNTIFNTKK